MNSINTFLYICLFTICSCEQIAENDFNMTSKDFKYTNELIKESSPYLLQHAHNPVNWYPWGKKALDKAITENKPIIVSIGYAACHWCHVMEHESFEDEEIAAYMNDNFICIKVDREERPDIDQVYMNAVQLITGQGGWPLNCITLPDGRPVYGGTYFNKKQWLHLLKQLDVFINQEPEKAKEQANTLTNGINSNEYIQLNNNPTQHSFNDLEDIFNHWKPNIDFINGGNKGAPKFPLPVGIQFLLDYHCLSNNEEALKAFTTTLDKMARGGIYDHIGGGFARYSTDAIWKVPHFEKMLYDNAQLVSLYANAYQFTKKKHYKTIITETLEFIEREMTSDECGFYSSLDADSEGVEGKFYVWDKVELDQLLGEDAALIQEYYNVTSAGNWEGANILYTTLNDAEFAAKHNISAKTLHVKLVQAKKKLLKIRKNRIRPGLDDKILTSWNALMLKGYVIAYNVLDDEEYLATALKNAHFIIDKCMEEDGKLNRNYKNGKSTINGFLDDYAFTISAFIELYQSTFDEKWLNEANKLNSYVLEHFYDSKSKMFFYTSDIDPALIARKMEISDNVIPGSNSEMAKNLFKLGKYLYNNEYLEIALQMINNIKDKARSAGPYYANWDLLLMWMIKDPFEVAIVGEDYLKIRKEFNQYYLPNVLFMGGKSEGSLELLSNKLIKGETNIYVCQHKSCKTPVSEVNLAIGQIKNTD